MKILITGISGALARLVTLELLDRGHEILGLDRRPWPDAPASVQMFHGDIRKRPAEEIFRSHRPEAVIHMATVTHFSARREERFRINLNGTRAVFERCHTYGVRRALFIGRHTVYGAAADTPLYHTEADPPLAASTFPELSDLVASDLFAGSALWRWPELNTSVLRLVYTLGPSRRGTLASFLRGGFVPTVFGFDPLYQFIHERDAAKAISTAVEHDLHGVFNVAGPQPVPLSTLCEVSGRQAVPIPEMFYRRALGNFGFPKLPEGAENHIKFPILVDDKLFREKTGFQHEFDEIRTMEAFRFTGK
jgi:UDP-glucose 4-epimerase